jgi:antitoxin component of MazEF toxin-antitoxin module
MIKIVTKVGNSGGLALGITVLKRAGLKPGARVNVAVHESGALVLTGIDKALSAEEVDELVKRARGS